MATHDTPRGRRSLTDTVGAAGSEGDAVAGRLGEDGFEAASEPLPAAVADALADAVEPLLAALGRGPRGGVRDLFAAAPAVADFARSAAVRGLVEPVLGAGCAAVNATLFDKSGGRNWKVPYHQDVTVRLRHRADADGFGPWWEKNGVPHVWPPARVLERMLAVRAHLDACGPANGPLRVVPGSHRHGVLGADRVAELRDRGPEVVVCLPRGGLLLMRPLLLHASSTATEPARRRVVHLEFAAADALPAGLGWWEAR